MGPGVTPPYPEAPSGDVDPLKGYSMRLLGADPRGRVRPVGRIGLD